MTLGRNDACPIVLADEIVELSKSARLLEDLICWRLEKYRKIYISSRDCLIEPVGAMIREGVALNSNEYITSILRTCNTQSSLECHSCILIIGILTILEGVSDVLN